MEEQQKDFNMLYKLGKQAPKKDDRTLKLAKYLSPELPPFPPSVSYSDNLTNWGMMLNDRLGCCTCSAGGHQIQNWTNCNGDLFTPPDSAILKAYEDVSGYDPRTGDNDNGANMLDVMKYLQKTGIAGRKIGPYLSIDIKNKTEVKTAIYLFGSINIGVMLPRSAQGQTEWDVVDWTLNGDAAPGSWGGHDVIITGYGDGYREVITWGQRMEMTAWFWDSYVDEAFVILDDEWLTNDIAPNHFNKELLLQDLSAL